jgi:hypothetical protein
MTKAAILDPRGNAEDQGSVKCATWSIHDTFHITWEVRLLSSCIDSVGWIAGDVEISKEHLDILKSKQPFSTVKDTVAYKVYLAIFELWQNFSDNIKILECEFSFLREFLETQRSV